MSVKEGKKVVAITLSKFYLNKLEVMAMRLGVSKSEMLRMMIDAYKMFPEYEEAPSDK